MMKLTALALVATIVVGCGTSVPTVPSVEPPGVDTSVLQQLLDDALAEAQRAAEAASVDLPATLAETLEQNDIELPAVPTNARDMCDALGTPGVGTAAPTMLRALIDSFVAGGEVGLAIGLLTTVVFTTCPVWSPHLETAIEQFL
jgi:hypothetical protein